MKILLTITLFFAFIQTHAFTIYGFIPWQSQISNSKPHKLNINENLEKFGIKKFRVLYHNSFLTDEDVLAIRSSSLSRKELSEKYGVSITQIGRIITRKLWTHI